MNTVVVDFAEAMGKVKPMHSVNNGPAHRLGAMDQQESNLELYKAAGIPYARNHDAAFYATYGGEHTVDISAVFPDFDADPNDPASYDFLLTDEYCQVIELGGAKVFYRLGSKIEHWHKKYGTLPPKDFHKWAVICEHIIRHYTEGWANGFHMDIEYWEIWNEPDLDPDDAPNKRCWGGTAQEFYELFDITLTHLKKCFPHLKIGGPATCAMNEKWLDGLFSRLSTPVDFFSWHRYAHDPKTINDLIYEARRILDKHGLTKAESILNEWNYVTSFSSAEAWLYSRKMEKGIKGAAFTAAVMCDSQYAPLDHLMYYDARPCGMNGLFDTDFPHEPLKGYYPFVMFNELYKLGTAARAQSDEATLHAAAATGDSKAACMVTYFDDYDSASAKQVAVTLKNLGGGVKKIRLALLDAAHDLTPLREETVTANECTLYLDMPLFSAWLIQID